MSAAGRTLRVSETTVSRRIGTLEDRLGIRLFQRGINGRYEATEPCLTILDRAEAVERENIAIRESVGQSVNAVAGIVRLTSVPVIVNRILVPELPRLKARHPGVTVELVPDARNSDLTKREADLAVRFSRPAKGGLSVKAQRIGALGFGVFGPASIQGADAETLGWIGYDDAHASLPQARWLDSVISGTPRQGGLRVSDIETALEAVACGLGKSLLPKMVAKADPRLRGLEHGAALPVRDVWLLSHADQTRAAISAVKTWLADVPWS